MGAVRDATGGFDAVWLSLVAVMFVQLALVRQLRPGLRQVG
jgi:CP family cyanate transporter-like MFS transporter